MARGASIMTVHEALDVLIEAVAPRTVLPSDVVKVARNPTSVLHYLLEWDDQRAARKYRLMQAACLIEGM